MNTETVDCYIVPAEPLPMLLPIDCIADVVESPEIMPIANVSAKWMKGHTIWNNQRLSVMSYSTLVGSALNDTDNDESENGQAHLVVLNPIPDAVRKAYTGIVCYGDVQQVSIESDAQLLDLPVGIDKRYVDGVLKSSGQQFIVPRLTALAVAFWYF